MQFLYSFMTIIEKFAGKVSAHISKIGALENAGLIYTAIARWIFILLAIFIVVKAIVALLTSKSPAEVWAYFNVDDSDNYPITHWENLIGRSKKSDLVVDDAMVSRSHGTLSRDDKGDWYYKDLGSKNGTIVNGEKLSGGEERKIEPGDTMVIGKSICTLFPISLEERRNNFEMRQNETMIESPESSFIALTIFQIMTMIQLRISLGSLYDVGITLSFIGIIAIMWIYVLLVRIMRRKGFEAEILAFFLSTISLAVTASKFPEHVFKQFLAIVIGIVLFILMCTIMRNLNRTKALKKPIYILAICLLLFNLVFGKTSFGAMNWVSIGNLTMQPSEIVKLAFIWCGAASLDELVEKRNSMVFIVFSAFCFICLALMGDFGTALIFFVTFLVISFLRSGDFTKIILIVGVAFAGGLMVIKFKSYIAERFQVWGNVWDYADSYGYQQTRTMSATASGGLIGVGAGGGWLKDIPASETDLVFGFVSEEWGLIIAILCVLAIVTLAIFAVRSIWIGRSTYYTIAACSAMTLFIFQTMLNVFGSVDLFPLTGVTFPFVSSGGTSMVSSWGMLAFLKAADTRLDATLAIANVNKDLSKKPKKKDLEDDPSYEDWEEDYPDEEAYEEEQYRDDEITDFDDLINLDLEEQDEDSDERKRNR